MRNPRLIAIALIAVLGYAGYVAWEYLSANVSVREIAFSEDRNALLESCRADPDCDLSKTLVIQLDRPILDADGTGANPELVRRANDGDPEASADYGYFLLFDDGHAAARPFLTTAAMAGNIGAHVQLGLIETHWVESGDQIRAWAHFDIALQSLKEGDADFFQAQKLHAEIGAALSDADLAKAQALADAFGETMRTNALN
jgi:hypothetical protein